MEVSIVNRFPERRFPARSFESLLLWLGRRMGRGSFGCTVLLCGDREMKGLNRRFLGRNSPTDVLSFPSGEDTGREGYLGDIAISVETAARQAAERGHGLGEEVRRLIVHGFLHLLGFDHEGGRGEMERLERALIRKMPRRRQIHRGRR